MYDFIRGLSPDPGAWTEIKKKETVVFFDDPKGDDDYVRMPEPTSHPSHKQSTQKIQVLKIFSMSLLARLHLSQHRHRLQSLPALQRPKVPQPVPANPQVVLLLNQLKLLQVIRALRA